jgi:hypothetical protein
MFDSQRAADGGIAVRDARPNGLKRAGRKQKATSRC